MNQPKRVLIVDDSATVRQVLAGIINSHPHLEVVGSAADPYIAREKIKQLNPDVITLDIEIPRMNGHQFLKNLMRLRPLPVVMISSLTSKNADATVEALENGAVDFVCKPTSDIENSLSLYADEVCQKLLVAADIDREVLRKKSEKLRAEQSTSAAQNADTSRQLIAIGASTGGTQAVDSILRQLPASTPGIVIVQHIPEAFSAAFAKKLNAGAVLTVKEAVHDEPVLQGHVYVAPGSQHLSIIRRDNCYQCQLSDAPPVNRHRPSVDVLFKSIAKYAAGNALGVLLTGMGQDGARGLLEIKTGGSTTLAQDEESSVVWGMPGTAVSLDAVDEVLPLNEIASRIRNEMKVTSVA